MATKNNGVVLYCVCRTEYQDDEFMIECDKCKEWFHGRCIDISENDAQFIDVYHCPSCVKQHGPITYKRKRVKHNYMELNHGLKPIYAGTKDFIRLIKARKFADAKNNICVLENGHLLSHEFLEVNGFKEPILILKSEGLGVSLPPRTFTVYDVEQHVGSFHELHVIDVAKQEDTKMRMKEWTEYYNCPIRTKVLNVISLEFSNTKLSQLVSAPLIVRDISWVENVWPENLNDESPHTMPYVQKYCLMGVKDSYTDFHIDFGGTSVWYHVLRGEKVFYLIEPTDENLAKYEKWVSSSNQNKVFFGDRVSHCIQCCVKQGQTLFIPTGWIHAVMTPIDTLVFGGNFLHSLNIGLQLKIYDLEHRLNTPIKFLFPNYEATCWYAARAILTKVKGIHGEGRKIPKYLFKGLGELIRYFKMWTYNKEDFMKFHQYQVPQGITPLKLIKVLDKEMKTDMTLKTSDYVVSSKFLGAVLSDIKDCHVGKMKNRMSKTVIKLKLMGPYPHREMESKKTRKLKKKKLSGAKKKKVQKSLNLDKGSKNKQKADRDGGQLEVENATNVGKSEFLKDDMKVFTGELSTLKTMNDAVIKENHFATSTSGGIHPGKSSQISTMPSTSESVQYEYQDWEAAQLLSNFHGMDARIQNSETAIRSSVATNLPSRNAIGDMTSDSKSVFASDALGPTRGENADESFDGYHIQLPLLKPKSSVKRPLSESDSDYDPDEEYYQDANYVYPRLDSNADLDGDDFAWNPSQRKRKKSKKLLKQRSNLNTQRRKDTFFSEMMEDYEGKVAKLSKKECAIPDEQERKKDKLRRGHATAKQRLGKLLKLDKLTGRYIR